MPSTRRAVLAGSAAAGATALFGRPLRAQAALIGAGNQAPGYYRFTLGDVRLTALNDGLWNRPIDRRFIRNVPFSTVRRAMAAAFMPSHSALPVPITALVVESGGKRVLIDTGSAGQIVDTAGTLNDNLAAAGIRPESIDIVLISHFHPDHIDDIKTKDNVRVFPNAEIKVPSAEWAYWMDDTHLRAAPADHKMYFLNARRIFADLAKEVTRFTPGEVAPGITAIAAPGHTPGHAAYAVASGRQSMLVLSDTAFHPALFVRHPEWQLSWDVDPVLAVKTRRRLLDRAAADRMLVQGYHFPFPASGHIARDGKGFSFVPVEWQPAP